MGNELASLRVVLNEAGRSYDAAEGDKRPYWAGYVDQLVDYLRRHGVQDRELTPLIDLQEALEFGVGVEDQKYEDVLDARTGNAAPSDAILARACAVLDLLVKEGKTEDAAAQIVTRKLIMAGVNPPDTGGDSRGWMRLVLWRHRLREGAVIPGVTAEYERFRDAVAEIPTRDRLNRVLTERLWDRRGPVIV